MKKRLSNVGFTFVELMVTIAILSGGLVLIYKSFFSCLTYINHLTYRLHATTMLDHKVAELERKFKADQTFDFSLEPQSEFFLINNKQVNFWYNYDAQMMDGLPSLYKLKVTISWQEDERPMTLTREAAVSSLSHVRLNKLKG